MQRWDEGLAKAAQSWTSKCIYAHGPLDASGGMVDGHGQNIYIWSNSYLNVTRGTYMWYDEKLYYNYDDDSCSKEPCGHYKQVSLIYLLYIKTVYSLPTVV